MFHVCPGVCKASIERSTRKEKVLRPKHPPQPSTSSLFSARLSSFLFTALGFQLSSELVGGRLVDLLCTERPQPGWDETTACWFLEVIASSAPCAFDHIGCW